MNSNLLDALPAAVYTTNLTGCITYYNDSAADLWGYRPQIGKSQWCGSWRLFWPDGRPMPHDECPTAITLKEGRPIRGQEAIAERPDGTRVRILPYPTPLFDDSNELTGAINLLVNLSDQYEIEALSARLAAIVTSSDDAIVSKSLDGVITSWNAGATRIFGYEPSEIIGQRITRIIPPELQEEETQILMRLRKGERVDHYETTRVAKDGRRIDVSLTVSPLRDRHGNVTGASKVARDISERKEADKLQQLLLKELSHRVNNTLAIIQSIASQSLRTTTSPSDFVSGFSGRIQSLARAHDLLSRAKFQGTDLREIVRQQVLFSEENDARIICEGPPLTLDPQSALQIGLVLHELATNARKYGALSVTNGGLEVNWEIRTNGGRSLSLAWNESHVPNLQVSGRRGFGSRLIEQTAKAHGGDAMVHYRADGICCLITIPLPSETLWNDGTQAIAQSELTEPHGKPSLKGTRVILIEDEPLLAMDMQSILTETGCKIVGSAGTLEQAKAVIRETVFDAALLDANLSGKPADELASMLTELNVPFAFVTGYGRNALPSLYRDVLLVEKPFSPEQLVAAIVKLILPGGP